MKSVKQNIKALLVVGIIALIGGGVLVPVAIATGFFEEYETTSAVIINAGSSTYAKVTKFNPMNILYIILGAILFAFGIVALVAYSKKKDDSVSIEENCVKVVSSKQHITIHYDEIESCASQQNQLNIKRKSDARPLGIWFIKNSYDLSKEINNRIKK